MADRPLTGKRLLVAGGDPGSAGLLVARLGAAGAAAVEADADPEVAAARAVSALPDAILVVGDAAPQLRTALDPFDLRTGPPVVELPADVAAAPGGTEAAVERVAAVLEVRVLRDRVTQLEAVLADHALSRAREAHEGHRDTLARLARAAEYRDDNTWEHTQRVAQLAARLAARLGVDTGAVELVRTAAPLHDVGKIAIPDTILLKPGRLTQEEFEVVKSHAVVGARVLAEADSDLLRTAEQIARSHHERWDGTGYPDGLSGDRIPLAARVVHVADVFDILSHERPHKEAWSTGEAAAEIRRGAGTQFDPQVVHAFDDLGPELWRAPAPLRDPPSAVRRTSVGPPGQQA
jgi:putative nucleotidyltransferase with HDIG domain